MHPEFSFSMVGRTGTRDTDEISSGTRTVKEIRGGEDDAGDVNRR